MIIVSLEEFEKNSEEFAKEYKFAGFFKNGGAKVALFKTGNNEFGKINNRYTFPSSYQKSVSYKNSIGKGRSWIEISTYMGGK